MTALKRTPLYDTHCRMGARMVDFAGFAMPVHYTSILEEHAAVRERAGLFDVSHMGQIYLSGPGAVAATERLLSCPVATLPQGAVRYGLLCNEGGGVVDDITVYRLGAQALFLCVNAANIEKDHRWILAHAGEAAEVEDRSAALGLLALQGPASQLILERASGLALGSLKRFRFVEATLAETHALLSRTGYTGSDGFEIYVESASTPRVFETLLAVGKPLGLQPCGLGARDTLRLEAALPLYGHELDDTTSPLEARLDRFVKLTQGGFLGFEAIAKRKAQGHPRLLVGFALEGRGIARSGHVLAHGGAAVGVVTSGGPAPSLGISIGLGYVPPSLASVGTPLSVVIRERSVAVRVVETPFVKASGPRRS
jgi:aminomethyltransferase